MSAKRIRSHWFADAPNHGVIRAAAQRAADCSGNTQRVHRHAAGEPCRGARCVTIKAKARR